MSVEIQKSNEEAVVKYEAGDLTIEDLTEEQIDLAADRELANLEGGVQKVTQSDVEEPEEVIEPIEPPKEAVSTIEEDAIIPLDHHQKLRDALAQANREKQLRENAQREIDRLKAETEKGSTIDHDRDLLADDHLRKIDKIDELERDLKEMKRKAREQEAETQTKNEQLGLFGEIQKLQSDFPILKTSESFQDIDSKFTTWQANAKAGNVNVDKYLKDLTYRAQADKAGHKLNISEQDLNNALKIYDVYSKYKAAKDENYNTSLAREFKDTTTYEELMKAKYSSHQQADDDALAEKIRERSTEAQIMSTGSNSAAPSIEAYESALMEMQIIASKTSTTAADEKRYAELEKMIEQLD